MYAEHLRDALPVVQERLARAAERSGRGGAAVRVVAVTKGHGVAAIEAALAGGLADIGENRVDELAEKVAAVGRQAATWHLIGHLQRNKVRRALPAFDLVHSVDSERLAEELSGEAVRVGGVAAVLVQVNTSGEASKYGFDEVAAVAAVGRLVELPGLHVRGLMTMAPYTAEEAVLRRTFAGLRRVGEACAAQIPAYTGTELSMGMSNDYEIAVEEGSTMVRLGTVLFGERAR
jgi:PLP dependent protein